MKEMYKKYLSLFFLFLFLFPQVEKAVHDFHHRDDLHCSEKKSVHFHEQEHVCSVCDYTIPVFNTPIEQEFDFALSVCSSNYFEYIESAPLSNNDYNFSPRAPPIV